MGQQSKVKDITIDECMDIICKKYGYGLVRKSILYNDIYRMALAYKWGYEAGQRVDQGGGMNGVDPAIILHRVEEMRASGDLTGAMCAGADVVYQSAGEPGKVIAIHADGRRVEGTFVGGVVMEGSRQYGLPKEQEPKYTTNAEGRLINRVSGEPIPDDEPVFVLRAKDRYAVAALAGYGRSLDPSSAHWGAVNARFREFEDWQIANPGKVREPDTAVDGGEKIERSQVSEGEEWASLASLMLNKGHEYWKAAVRERGPGAVQWARGDDGALFVFTRGEYAGEIIEFLSKLPMHQTKAVGQEDIGSEWVPCMKLPVVVHVREQRPGEEHVSTREGITPLKKDDLIMRGVEGEEYPIGRELFNKTYRLVEKKG